jgi:hypothetical protein
MALPGVIPKNASNQNQVTSYCVERWAARLSRAPDNASQVVAAVMAACGNAISYLEGMKAKEDPGSELPIAAARNYGQERALFIVIQARAGGCYKDA